MSAARLRAVPDLEPNGWPKPREVPTRHLQGNAEVRKMCGNVTRHTLIRWRHRENFPPPVRELESGEIWDGRQVSQWWRARQA